jgi:predicted ATP-grasp superfamily ATP-dependent carboligase
MLKTANGASGEAARVEEQAHTPARAEPVDGAVARRAPHASRAGQNARPRVLITNAEERSVLAACRSLHEGGYDVTATSCTRVAAAQWSRSCKRRIRAIDVREDAEAFVEQLRQELARRSYATVLPGSDRALLALSQARAQLDPLTELGLPQASVVEQALSRERLAEAAGLAGLVPASSVRCVGLEQALTAARGLGFPVVLKSTDAVSANNGVVRSVPKGQIATSESDLAKRTPAFGGELLVQRFMGNEVVSFGGVMAGGSLIGVAVSRYKRMWPPNSGSVTYSETVIAPGRLEGMVERLLALIGWEGLFELEMVQIGPEEFVPIDLNPRVYGSMALAGAAGAPLARIWCDWLLGRSARPMRARPGHRYRWEDGDLRHLSWQARRGHFLAAVAPLKPHRSVTHAHFKLSDPLPLLANGLHLGGVCLGKLPKRAVS